MDGEGKESLLGLRLCRCRGTQIRLSPTVIAIGLLLAFVHPSPAADESFLPFAVNVHRTPVQSWSGYGIYLGRGYFITAAHVVGRAWLHRPKIAIAGSEYPTSVVKEGSFEGTDLTLLFVDENLLPFKLRLRKNTLCKRPPWPGEAIATAVPEGTARSYVLSPDRLPVSVRRFSTVIADTAHTGNSGSGVFDVHERCLLGIMSRMISQATRTDNGKLKNVDIAKYFVPSTEIAQFLPPGLSF